MNNHLERLQEISINSNPTEEQIIDFFQIVEQNYPDWTWVNNREVRGFVERVERNISSQPWAREWSDAIRSSREHRRSLIISTGRSPLPDVRNVSAFNPRNLESTARQVIDSNIETRNNRNIFLYQMYINNVANLRLTVDGVAWTRTLEAIWNNIEETQVFLRSLGAKNSDGITPITVDGIIGENTGNALREYFDITDIDSASLTVIETTTQALEELQGITDNELIRRLNEANNHLPQRNREKRSFISEFARRFNQRHIIVRVDENNVHRLVDHEGTIIDIWISDVDLQAIMILLSVRSSNIEDDREAFSENIANNIFDSVIETYNLKNGNRHWRAQDFIASWGIITQAEVEENKQSAISQINGQIIELEEALWSAQADIDRSNLRTQIQRLEIARMFVRNQNWAFSGESLSIAQSISEDTNNLIQALGGWEAARNAVNRWSVSEIRAALMSNVPSFIVGGIFALLARMLPSPFKEVAYGIIWGIVGLGVFEDLQNRWLVPSGSWSPSGINRPSVMSPDRNNLSDALREILTRAPTGIEERHKARYVDVVTKNNEVGAIQERQKLDHMYLFLSQDFIFWSQEIASINTDNQGNNEIWDQMSEYTKWRLQELWITTSDLILFLRILKETNSDTADRNMQDIFVIGQVTDADNLPNVVWIQGNEFQDENRDINLFVSRLTWVSAWAPENIQGNSIRARVETIISEAQPGVLSWLSQNLAERTSLVGEQVPTSESIEQIISQLQEIWVTWNDGDIIRGIIWVYEKIKNILKIDEDIASFTTEARNIYTISWRTFRSIEDTFYWIQNWGDPLPENSRSAITNDTIEEIINNWTSLLNRDWLNEEQRNAINEVIRNLRLYLIRSLDTESRNENLTDSERWNIINLSNRILTEDINSNPDIYENMLSSLSQRLSPLRQEQTSTSAYHRLLSTHRQDLAVLQRLQSLNTNIEEFNIQSQTVFSESFTDGIVRNLQSHFTSKITQLNGLDVESVTTIWELNEVENEFISLANELTWRDVLTDTRAYFGITENMNFQLWNRTVENLPAILSQIILEIYNEADGVQNNFWFEEQVLIQKQTEINDMIRLLESNLEIELSDIDDNELTDITTISNLREEIVRLYNQISETRSTNIRENQRESLRQQVSEIITRLSEKLREVWDDLDELDRYLNIYTTLTDTNIWNAWNQVFENTMKEKEEEIFRNALLETSLHTIYESNTGTTFSQQLTQLMNNNNVQLLLRSNPSISWVPAQDILNPENYRNTSLVQLFDLLDFLSHQRLTTEEETENFRNLISTIKNNIERDATWAIDRRVKSWILERYSSIESFLNSLTR